jgi:hypothetical protein
MLHPEVDRVTAEFHTSPDTFMRDLHACEGVAAGGIAWRERE